MLMTAISGLIVFSSSAYAQKNSVRKYIERSNQQFMKWFNSGKADSILLQYHPSACLASGSCGMASIRDHYRSEVGKYTIRELTTVTVDVKDTIATETGRWILQLASGGELAGNYRTEWRKAKSGWLIFRETILN
jgi:hypothetical protein